jgi:hypothetical protein
MVLDRPWADQTRASVTVISDEPVPQVALIRPGPSIP